MIKLGYELITGEESNIDPSHMIVTGVSQRSGKTTTLEALASRYKGKVVVFRTKPGEKAFSDKGVLIPPFYRGRNDYEFVKSLIENFSGEKISAERATLMELCRGANSLEDIKYSVDNTLISNGKIRRDVYVRLQHYLDALIPKIRNANLSKNLEIIHGINVMDLEDFSEEIQSLIIQSTLDEILKTLKNIIVIIPESWRFLPERRGGPCKQAIESFIRQGATNGNYLWLDSQDLSGTDKSPLKQVSTYILGYQSEINEVKHTLNQIPLPAKAKPTPDQIMTLKIGQFFLASNEGTKRVYVQPVWIGDEEAKMVAMGKAPTPIPTRNQKPVPKNSILADDKHNFPVSRVDLIDLDWTREHTERCFNRGDKSVSSQRIAEKSEEGTKAPDDLRITYLETQLKSLRAELFNKAEELEMKIRSQTPTVYMVSPLEKIKKDFQEETKNYILSEAAKLDDDQKKILFFVESQGKGCNLTMIVDKCLHLSATSGGTRDKYSKKIKEMELLQVVRKDKNNTVYPNLKAFIWSYCAVHGVTEQEIQQVYDHVLAGMMG